MVLTELGTWEEIKAILWILFFLITTWEFEKHFHFGLPNLQVVRLHAKFYHKKLIKVRFDKNVSEVKGLIVFFCPRPFYSLQHHDMVTTGIHTCRRNFRACPTSATSNSVINWGHYHKDNFKTKNDSKHIMKCEIKFKSNRHYNIIKLPKLSSITNFNLFTLEEIN